MYRLIMAYRAKGTVFVGRAANDGPAQRSPFVLDAKRERLIASAIYEIYLKPERPTLTFLIEQVRARCAQKNLPLPDRRTIKARVDRIDRRTVSVKRKDANGVKATKAVPGRFAASRPLEIMHRSITPRSMSSLSMKQQGRRWTRDHGLRSRSTCSRAWLSDFICPSDKPSRVSLGLYAMLNAVYDKSAWLKEREIDASHGRRPGLPETVHSDNGADFRSHAFAWACREEGIQRLIFRPKGAPHYACVPYRGA